MPDQCVVTEDLRVPVEEVERALRDGLAWLHDRWRQQTRPDDALQCLAGLQGAHRALDIDLVWEEEDYSKTVHYDLLIRAGEQGTISLSLCPDSAVPWPLRNAFRAPDGWIARVNGRVIDASTAMTTLDAIWDKGDLVQGLVNLGLIDEAVTRRGLTVSIAELQRAMNAFRRKHALWTKAQTADYLDQHGLTQRDLERRLESELFTEKLREQVTHGKIESYFAEHRKDFDTAHVARFRLEDEAAAESIAAEVRAGLRDFLDVAQTQFLADVQSGLAFVRLRRGELSLEYAGPVFSAAPGEMVLVRNVDGYDVVRVLRTDPAQLDDSTRFAVRQAIFDEWLAQERRSAQITWFWGDPGRLQNQNTGWAR